MPDSQVLFSNIWRCPVCGGPLLLNETYQCSLGHSFDPAKEGYINLLLPNQKRSTHPGDNKAMLRHRRDFLNKGHYGKLATQLAHICQEHAPTTDKLAILDTGCGEGYYSHFLASALKSRLSWFGGIDISKEAIRMAAKAYPRIHFAVASTARIPMADNSIDIMLRIFAPGTISEVERCLKPDAIYITVTPGPDHLFELRGLVYDEPEKHGYQQDTLSGLRLLETSHLKFELQLDDSQDIANLFSMTPYYWQADQDKQEKIFSLEQLTTRVDFAIRVYKNVN